MNAHKYLTRSIKCVCVTCKFSYRKFIIELCISPRSHQDWRQNNFNWLFPEKPDFQDEPCIAFYSLCLYCDKQPLPGDKQPHSLFWETHDCIFHVWYLNIVIGLQRTWDSLTFAVSICPRQFNLQKYCLSRSATLHLSQFKTRRKMKSLVKIKWLMKYTIMRRFWFFKNVYQSVKFMNILMLKQQSVLRLISTNSWKWRSLDSLKSL